jgi:hypothetical protein
MLFCVLIGRHFAYAGREVMDSEQDQIRKAGTPADSRDRPMDRRTALARLGLAGGIAYLAPTLATLKGASAEETPEAPP